MDVKGCVTKLCTTHTKKNRRFESTRVSENGFLNAADFCVGTHYCVCALLTARLYYDMR